MLTLTEAGTKNLLLHVRELADLYALKTLYDYLAKRRDEGTLDARLFFGGRLDSDRSRDILQNAPTRDQLQGASIDAIVSCFSDIGGGGDLEIDISILKSAVVPMNDREKAQLRQKYAVKSKEPVLVIGYSSPSPSVAKVVEAASKHATVYLVGHGKKDDYNLSPDAKAKVHVINKHGVLKDFYAMADVAISADNLLHSSAPLHNFVEATEGGRLFMIPSSNSDQYGYRQLVDVGVIVECADLDDLASRVTDSLRNFNGNSQVVEARSRHLMQTRDSYLPVILAKIMQLAGEEIPMPDSDLNIIQTGKGVRIMHPDSNWDLKLSNFFIHSTFNDIEFMDSYFGKKSLEDVLSRFLEKKCSSIDSIRNIYKIYDTDSKYISKLLPEKERVFLHENPFRNPLILREPQYNDHPKKHKKQTGPPFDFNDEHGSNGYIDGLSALLARYQNLKPKVSKILNSQ